MVDFPELDIFDAEIEELSQFGGFGGWFGILEREHDHHSSEVAIWLSLLLLMRSDGQPQPVENLLFES